MKLWTFDVCSISRVGIKCSKHRCLFSIKFKLLSLNNLLIQAHTMRSWFIDVLYNIEFDRKLERRHRATACGWFIQFIGTFTDNWNLIWVWKLINSCGGYTVNSPLILTEWADTECRIVLYDVLGQPFQQINFNFQNNYVRNLNSMRCTLHMLRFSLIFQRSDVVVV